MALSYTDLLTRGALRQAQMFLSDGETTGYILDWLARRYLGQPLADLQSVIETAQQIIVARDNVNAMGAGQQFPLANIPFVPIVPAGMFEVGVQFAFGNQGDPFAGRGFGRVNLTIDDIRYGIVLAIFRELDYTAMSDSEIWDRLRMFSQSLKGVFREAFHEIADLLDPTMQGLVDAFDIPKSVPREALDETMRKWIREWWDRRKRDSLGGTNAPDAIDPDWLVSTIQRNII